MMVMIHDGFVDNEYGLTKAKEKWFVLWREQKKAKLKRTTTILTWKFEDFLSFFWYLVHAELLSLLVSLHTMV